VIIPTVQRPQLVLRAIRGVLGQTMGEIEAIVVVDGPDPETLEALASIGDPRLRVKALPTRVGASGARNVGVSEAYSRWIAFLDDDDEWLPEKLEIQLRTAEQCPCPHPIVSCRFFARSEEGDLVWPRRAPATDESVSEYLFCQHGLRAGDGIVLPSAVLTSKDLLLRIPFDESLPRYNDVDWLLRATAIAGTRIVFPPSAEPLAVWHMETNRPRISNTADWRYTLDWIEARRHLATPRARASFVLTSTSSTAARGGHWKAFWLLPWAAFAHGRPRPIDLLAHLSIWLVPAKMRSRLSVFLDSRRRDAHGEPLRPVVETREQSHD
jgi:glycosyltransferase involved in cell wall biosynthesis